MMGAPEIIIAAGTVTAANEVLFAPLAAGHSTFQSFNWRIIPATALLAVGMAGLESLSPGFARILALTILLTVTIAPVGKGAAPLENISKMLGYSK